MKDNNTVIDIRIKEKNKNFFTILDEIRNVPINDAVKIIEQKWENPLNKKGDKNRRQPRIR